MSDKKREKVGKGLEEVGRGIAIAGIWIGAGILGAFADISSKDVWTLLFIILVFSVIVGSC